VPGLGYLLAAIIVISVLEAGFLLTQPRARQARIYPTVLAALGLVGAWTAAWAELGLVFVLAPLTFSLVAHLVDLRRRW
jgi:hypothetical protein